MRRTGIAGVGVSIAVVAGALAACVPSAPVPPATSGNAGTTGTVTGSAGVTGTATGSAGTSSTAPTGMAGTGPVTPLPTGIGGTTATGAGGAATCTGAGGTLSRMVPSIPVQLPTTITHATTPVPPLSGDPERDLVFFVDLTTNTVRGSATLQPGDEPGRAVEDADGRVHVVLRRGGAIATLDPATATLSARRDVCTAPRGIAYQASTNQLQVACAGGELVSLPPDGGAATRTLTLDRDLRDVVVGADGALLISTFRKAEILVVDGTGTVTARLQAGSGVLPSLATGMPQMRTPSVAWRMVAVGAETGDVAMLHQTGVTDVVDPDAGGYAGVKGCG